VRNIPNRWALLNAQPGLAVLIDEYGALNVLGRSDGVLNPQGVRFGSAELYAIVEEMKDE